MNTHLTSNKLDWEPILSRLQSTEKQDLPSYPGDLKTALLRHAGLTSDPRGDEAYRLAVEVSRLTTCCDSEIVYWFSRLVALIEPATSLK